MARTRSFLFATVALCAPAFMAAAGVFAAAAHATVQLGAVLVGLAKAAATWVLAPLLPQAEREASVLPLYRAKQFTRRIEKRERPVLSSSWRMCPSI